MTVMLMLLSRAPVAPSLFVTTATKPPCSFFESHNFNATRVTMPGQFYHLPSELSYRDSPPAIIQGPNTMEHENMPVTGPHPVVDILCTVRTDKTTAYTLKIRLPDETAVQLELVYCMSQRIVGLISSPTCLLIARIDYG